MINCLDEWIRKCWCKFGLDFQGRAGNKKKNDTQENQGFDNKEYCLILLFNHIINLDQVGDPLWIAATTWDGNQSATSSATLRRELPNG